ncbi:MAG: deoxyribodipyrimidine photo-lyase [Sulfurospirillum sp.]|nr:deoxyribodipyrimidine photo-lyase [Sulfurospirillum sp.]
MKSILWFRRDLRVNDNAILAHAKGEVLPIFIFDTNILSGLDRDDKRVSFIYQSVLQLKIDLQILGLDLAVYYGDPELIFAQLKQDGFKSVLCSCDFDAYALQRDRQIETILEMKRFYDSYLLHPSLHVKADSTPYRVFTPYYKALHPLWMSDYIEQFVPAKNLQLAKANFTSVPTLSDMGFVMQKLPDFLYKSSSDHLEDFVAKIEHYKENRDFFALDGTSNMGIRLRFGLISPKQIFNRVKREVGSEFYIRELFWREFYAYILYHFPQTQYENFNDSEVAYENNERYFQAWCDGETGFPLIDATMRHFNQTGLMHNRLRMITASFLCKNLLIDWRWGEQYFAKKLLDYEASSNIGSWQWAAGTGADAAPYFRIFNPCLQSEKFDAQAKFIRSIIPQLAQCTPKSLHVEGGLGENLFLDYPKPIISLAVSRQKALAAFSKKTV